MIYLKKNNFNKYTLALKNKSLTLKEFEDYLKKDQYFSIITWEIDSFIIMFVSSDKKIALCNINNPLVMTDTEEIKRVFDEQKDLRLNSLDIISSFENLNNWGKIKKNLQNGSINKIFFHQKTQCFTMRGVVRIYMYKWYDDSWARREDISKFYK